MVTPTDPAAYTWTDLLDTDQQLDAILRAFDVPGETIGRPDLGPHPEAVAARDLARTQIDGLRAQLEAVRAELADERATLARVRGVAQAWTGRGLQVSLRTAGTTLLRVLDGGRA